MSHWYDEWHSKMLDRSRQLSFLERKLVTPPAEKILDTLKPIFVAGQTLLDIGCGWGDALRKASALSLDPVGVDISNVALKICKKHFEKERFPLLRSDSRHLPFRDDTFDFVICLGSLEHFPDMPLAIKEMSRVLKQTGLALIFVPNSYFLGHIYLVWRTGVAPEEADQRGHETFLTRLQWQRLLEANHLCVCKVWKFNEIWASKKCHYRPKWSTTSFCDGLFL